MIGTSAYNSIISSPTVAEVSPYEINMTSEISLQLVPPNRWSMKIPFDYLGRPSFLEGILVLPRRLTDPLYGREELNRWLKNTSLVAPAIEDVWKITEKLPSLAKLISEERDNE